MTFSIVACDVATGQWGVAVQSKFLAAGAVVPSAQAGVGALATQANANASYGPRGMALLAQGVPAVDVVRLLTGPDEGRETRQLGVVDAQGRAAAHTGRQCMNWAGHVIGEGYCCQGNILAGPEVVASMARAFEAAPGALAERLVAALEGGQSAGGDRRGQQAAGLLVVQAKAGYGGFSDRLVDLRVDEHPAPIAELRRIFELSQLYFGKTRPADILPIEGALAQELQQIVQRAGYYQGPLTGAYDEATRSALYRLIHTENLEAREFPDARIDRVVLAYLREHFGA